MSFILYFVYIAQPSTYIVKRLTIRYVVDEHDAHGASVEACCYGLEALLTRGVPFFVKGKNTNQIKLSRGYRGR